MAEDPAGARAVVDVHATGGWYGWQILLADLGAITTLSVGGALSSHSSSFAAFSVAGGVVFYAGGPLVHVAHHSGPAAVRSVLLRLLVPIGGAALGLGVGALIYSGQPRSDCSEGCAKSVLGIMGFGAGMLGAMATDWIIAREPIGALPGSSEATASSWTPTLVLTREGAGAGIVVRF